MTDQDELSELGIKVVEQTSLEQQIQTNANQLINQQEIESDKKRLEKSQSQLVKVRHEVNKLHDRLNNPRTKISVKEELRQQVKLLEANQLIPLLQDIEDIKLRLEEKENGVDERDKIEGRLPNETEKDFLIRTGQITAFGNSTGFVVEEDDSHKEPENVISHQNLRIPGLQNTNNKEDNEYEPEEQGNMFEEDEENSADFKLLNDDDIRNIDDGVESFYQNRLKSWIYRRSKLRKQEDKGSNIPEYLRPHLSIPDAVLNNDFKIPGDIYPSLFDYQKTGVQWLYELYLQKHGGIISDEMGLGKTIQIISFVAGLHYSGKLTKPVLIVCPATVMTQWVNEFHTWWPPLRTMVLHSIGSGMSKKGMKEEDFEKALLMEGDDSTTNINQLKQNANTVKIMDKLVKNGHILITSYVGLRIYEDHLLKIDWNYVVLDEGHKIKNPNSNITILSKRLKTHNRVILSGTPIQNNLVELWSLFDFIFPGRLGTLPIFQEEFEQPIKAGGYANATNLEVKVGYQKAVILKDLIQPYLLRRMKVDVAKDLPSKQEYVLMCKLTKYQKDKYLEFLHSIEFKANSYFGAIDTLRKICNHPDLADVHFKENQPGYGDPSRSGKLQVLKSLITTWTKEGHKILLFTQTRQMMNILEKFLNSSMSTDFKYMKMSGETSIGKRQDMIFEFNNEDYNLFLLTTKVGGLGVNLTGADRVIIFDPDWNPSTDLQARERAWRLGQKKEVLIYRLVIGGSIEEKIYHRQIFKQLLTDKILKDPNQKRFFKNHELHDLFTLSDFDDNSENDLLKSKENDDLAKIQGISKLETYKEDAKVETEDDRLMDGLFKSSQIQAIKHDQIVDSHSKPSQDMIDKEAQRVANKALEVLKTSRKQVKKAALGVPTFTGKFGSAGKIFKKRAGLLPNSNTKPNSNSSSSILLNMKKQQEQELQNKKVDGDTKIIGLMRDYLSNQEEYFAKSADILKNCNIKINEQTDLSKIRAMLKGIGTWDNEKKGWRLLAEFR